MMQTRMPSSCWGRRVFFLTIALGIPLVVSAATIPLIDLGPGSGGITFGVAPATVSLPSDIIGSGSVDSIALPWSVVTSPSSTFDLVGGDVQSPSSTESMTFNVSDALGDSITGSIVTFGNPSTPDFFSYTPDGTGGDLFSGTVQVSSVTEGVLLEGLGLTPAALDGTDLALTLHVDCGSSDPCIAPTDPQGTIIDATIGPATPAPSSVPEPSFIFLLAGAFVTLPLVRRLKRAS